MQEATLSQNKHLVFNTNKKIQIQNMYLTGWVGARAHHQEPATTPYSCHGVFTDRCIFSSNLTRIQSPSGSAVTNHKH